MVTLKEIAEMCGVSPTTVSNILNGKSKASVETTRKVLETVKRMDYHPNFMAKGLRTQSAKTIAIIAEDIHQFTTPAIIGAVMEELERHGYSVFLENLRLYERWSDTWYDSNDTLWSILEHALRMCRSYGVDGIIYIAGHARNIDCIPADFPIPVVMAYAYAANANIPSVVIDDEQGAYEVADYLLKKGHRQIALLEGREDNIHTQLRLKGVMRAMYENQCAINPAWIKEGRWNRKDGLEAARELELDKNNITAVFSMNDEMAAGVYDAIEELGLRVGEDISVAGFDDADIAQYFRPSLTTTRLPLEEIGRKSAEILVSKLQRQNPLEAEDVDEKITRISCTFIERSSVEPLLK